MKKTRSSFLIILTLLSLTAGAKTIELPFTSDDRDRLVRTEQKVESFDDKLDTRITGMHTEMTARFDAVDKRFDQLFQFLWVIIGVFTTMMVSVFGFAFWDRKLSLSPLKRENEKIVSALRDYSKNQPKLQELLRSAGLM